MLKTFDEWKAEGMYVLKGQHACLRKDGKCYFNENQVASAKEIIQSQIRAHNAEKRHNKEILEKMKRAKEDYRRCRPPHPVDDIDHVSYSKDEALDWLAGQGCSVYNEQCSELDGIGVADVINMMDIPDDI